jgi:16S rRNA A1518/A1519 N6-dimethyltransferase RsmA/KsgA/DIM1 with predicted DNA glycosylase/AP lyase activity
LFSLADSHKAIKKAIVTMQLEVALRIIAKPSTKEYGIPSVVFQLYSTPLMNFKIPPTVFYPVPKVDSALITLDFTTPHPLLHTVDGNQLRRFVTYLSISIAIIVFYYY